MWYRMMLFRLLCSEVEVTTKFYHRDNELVEHFSNGNCPFVLYVDYISSYLRYTFTALD
jgi:hypothetical protein